MQVKLTQAVTIAVVQFNKPEVQKINDVLTAYNANNGNTDNDAVVLAQAIAALLAKMP